MRPRTSVRGRFFAPGDPMFAQMPARRRKLIGLGVILAFLVFYVGAAAWVGDRVPQNNLLQALYFIVAGTAWFVPLIPVVRWMNRGP
jgi:hypothetical protein